MGKLRVPVALEIGIEDGEPALRDAQVAHVAADPVIGLLGILLSYCPIGGSAARTRRN